MHRSGVTMAWNVFKFCTAFKALGSIMILLVLGVVGVTYYAVVVTNYGPALFAGGFDLDFLTAVLVLILFHFLLIMLLWSYFSVVLTEPGSVPPNWRPVMDEESGENEPLHGMDYSNAQIDGSNPNIRYCRKCNHAKPPRCHHCSVCGRCVLKMDHHCVWVVNCVGALNYKYFLLFLFYTFLETTLVTLSLMPYFLALFSDEEMPGSPTMLATTFLVFVLNLAFALSVMGFLIMHISLVSANTTTIEAYEKKTGLRWRFDLGRKKNFEQFMNKNTNLNWQMKPLTREVCRTDLENPSGRLYINFSLNSDQYKVFGINRKYWFIPAYSEDLRRMQLFRVLNIHQSLTWMPKVSRPSLTRCQNEDMLPAS